VLLDIVIIKLIAFSIGLVIDGRVTMAGSIIIPDLPLWSHS